MVRKSAEALCASASKTQAATQLSEGIALTSPGKRTNVCVATRQSVTQQRSWRKSMKNGRGTDGGRTQIMFTYHNLAQTSGGTYPPDDSPAHLSR